MLNKYEKTRSDKERTCPYCGAEIFVEADEYSEEDRTEECPDCGKKFIAYETFQVTHHAEPDCELNGEDHVWGSPIGNLRFCKVCGRPRSFYNPSQTYRKG